MEVAVHRVLVLLCLALFTQSGESKPALRDPSAFNVSLPDHLDIQLLTTATRTFYFLTGTKDPHVMVNRNQQPCAVFEDPVITVKHREGMVICHCWLVEYNWDGTVAVARLPYAVTSGWTHGHTVDTGLLLIDAEVCSPLPCCSATSPRRKREDAADEYYYAYEDSTDSEGLRAGAKTKVKKKKQSTKTTTSSGLSTVAIVGIVIGIIAVSSILLFMILILQLRLFKGVLVICGVILGYCYYLYKQEIARIRFRNRRIEQNNKRAAAARAARKA